MSDREFVCKNCGGDMIGDGYTTVFHCENADWDSFCDHEPDANPVYCNWSEEDSEDENP